MARLQIRLLGGFHVVWDGTSLAQAFRSDKTRALLTYLAVEGSVPHRREALADLLWGEATHMSSRASLRMALSNLRHLFAPLEEGTPFLVTTRQIVELDTSHPDCWIDLIEFDRLAREQQPYLRQGLVHCEACLLRLTRMAELYAGDLLSGFTLPDTVAFDEWLVVEQQARHGQILEVLAMLVEHHRGLKNYERVERYARQQTQLEPWLEGAHRALMWALAMQGRRTAALAQYEICRQSLEETLHVPPEAATRELYEQIRRDHTAGLVDDHAGGDVIGTLIGRVGAIHARLGPVEKEAAHQIFARLTVQAECGGYVRRRVPRADLLSLTWRASDAPTHEAGQRQALETVLDLFIHHGLFTFDQDPAVETPSVEIAYEALVEPWRHLNQVHPASPEEIRLPVRPVPPAASVPPDGERVCRRDGDRLRVLLVALAALALFFAGWASHALIYRRRAEPEAVL